MKSSICPFRCHILEKCARIIYCRSLVIPTPANFQQKGRVVLAPSRWMLNVSWILCTMDACLAWTVVSQCSYLGTLASPSSVKSGGYKPGVYKQATETTAFGKASSRS